MKREGGRVERVRRRITSLSGGARDLVYTVSDRVQNRG